MPDFWKGTTVIDRRYKGTGEGIPRLQPRNAAGWGGRADCVRRQAGGSPYRGGRGKAQGRMQKLRTWRQGTAALQQTSNLKLRWEEGESAVLEMEGDGGGIVMTAGGLLDFFSHIFRSVERLQMQRVGNEQPTLVSITLQ